MHRAVTLIVVVIAGSNNPRSIPLGNLTLLITAREQPPLDVNIQDGTTKVGTKFLNKITVT